MPPIELPKETRDALAKALSRYLKDELDLEVEGFDAVFLADFITENLGPYFYNQGSPTPRPCSRGRPTRSSKRSTSSSSR